ncbi:uncharacterized protein LOC123509274, partial [Portunus trituberculatus]|uniref:uncharacterized protein LOC123509274 n=1 Tax=Portunus trituberculatus TaxID=210409 RepID=UPI001E1CE006
MGEYQGLVQGLTVPLKDVLERHPYDTLTNFVRFCESYRAWRDSKYQDQDPQQSSSASLRDFYRDYEPPMISGRHTCVGLTCLLQTRLAALEHAYPGLKDATYKVGCEEEVDNVAWFCAESLPPHTCEMEHVLLCIRVRLCGRPGVVLLDPGYHVGEVVTVMEDGRHPTSGFVQGGATGGVQKWYRYRTWRENAGFVTWEVVTRRRKGGGGEEQEQEEQQQKGGGGEEEGGRGGGNDYMNTNAKAG